MINGPYTTLLLSDLGADVIKVEPPEGDPYRSRGGFMPCNRGKRSLAVDLKIPQGREIVFKLISTSDLMAENARWGVWHRLGLDYESVAKIKPDIIYISVLGFGSKGPDSNLPAYDPIMQARRREMDLCSLSLRGSLASPVFGHETGGFALRLKIHHA